MAKKQPKNASRAKWQKDWSVRVNVWVERHGKTVLDEGSAVLLAALNRTNSISAAARALGISYRHAWLQIQSANTQAGQALVETAIGGERGGGTRLTEYGRTALDVFQKLQDDLRGAAVKSLPKVLANVTEQRTVIHLAAAISLQEVVAQILDEYALIRPTASVQTLFGASNELATQIEQGSAIDVIIAASRGPINELASLGFVRRGSRRVLAHNGLACVSNPDFKPTVRKAADLKKSGECQIVVADPTCPLGDCTKNFLLKERVYTELEPRFVTVNNSRAVVTALRAKRPRVGIVFTSDLQHMAGSRMLFDVPVRKMSTDYEGAAVVGSAQKEEVDRFLEFLQADMAKGCFRRCGFIVPQR
jgi:molybdenum ABC transporter molybdate-binding protein